MTHDPDPDAGIRLAAFEHLRHLVAAHGPVLPWGVLSPGFSHQGETVLLGSIPRGIHRPSQMRGGALSIKTTVPKAGRAARYDDQIASSLGHFVYKLQGKDPDAHDNRWLLEAHRLQAPMVYLYGVAPALYRPIWPVFVTAWNPAALECFVVVDEVGAAAQAGRDRLTEIRREYATLESKKRLHQDAFRALVMRAYRTRCAVCNLPRSELLDACHIIPDRDERGRPEVPNGLALCQLHHRAYDRNLIGIRPDLVVEVSRVLMDDHDGPVLEHALKGFNGSRLHIPSRREEHPRPDYLEERYLAFREAG